ncbi:hypothetical protein HDU88_009031 [Geranomyces variabilis]|nr:hypothetical protein HDU88_009031 [Geranomyces variabilis]
MTMKFGGKQVDTIEDFPQLVMDSYQFANVAQKKYLAINEGVGNSAAFHNLNGSFVVKHHIMAPSFRPINGQALPLCVLPNQAIELTCTLNTPQSAFTNAAAGSYFVVSDVRYVAQLVTPSAAYLTTLWQGIRTANSRVIGMTHRFRKSDAYTTQTRDKANIYDTAGLLEWRMQIGHYWLPLTENFKVEDALMIRDLSMNDLNSYQTEDIVSVDDFYNKNFVMTYAWISSDEDEQSSLSLIGTDGNLRLITIHDPANTPSTDRTLLIGETVDVV